MPPRMRGLFTGGILIKNVRKMVLASLFAALTAVCAWISIPVPPIMLTLQTFAVFLTLLVLGGKWGAVSILLYLLTGFVGLPVFSGFRSGIAAFLDPTGGFLWGFAVSALVFWFVEKWGKLPAMVLSMAVCYACGCLWFSAYAGNTGLWAAVLTCVVPYLIPDGIKLWLAYTISKRLKKYAQ